MVSIIIKFEYLLFCHIFLYLDIWPTSSIGVAIKFEVLS